MSTLIGGTKRKNGILNNEIYIGTLIFNRQSFRKDPKTGKRVAAEQGRASDPRAPSGTGQNRTADLGCRAEAARRCSWRRGTSIDELKPFTINAVKAALCDLILLARLAEVLRREADRQLADRYTGRQECRPPTDRGERQNRQSDPEH